MTSKTLEIRRWASLAEAADYIHISQKTLRRMIAAGSITGYRLNARLVRLDLNEIDAALSPIQSLVNL